jgi:hypothetical protein
MKILTIFCSGKNGVKQEYLDEIKTLHFGFILQMLPNVEGD